MDKIFILENQVKFLEVKYSQAIELLNEAKNSLVEFENYELAKKIKTHIDVSGLDPDRFKIESTKRTNEKGNMNQTNWMLDEVIETYNDHWNQKDLLIKKLTIQKVEYGRTCIAQLFATGTPRATNYHEVDDSLKKVIIKLGGIPKEIKFFDYL